MKKSAGFRILVFLVCVGISLNGCHQNQPPKIFPALPTTITISTNQIYYYNLANHQSDDRDEPEEMRWSLTKIGDQLFFAEINPPRQLVLTSQEQAGSDNITLILTDSSGRSVAQELEVIVNDELPGPIEGEVEIIDNEPNVMFELRGERVMYVEINKAFIDPGASALDTYDGSLTVTIVSTVNTAVLGTYTVTYTATDSSGNTATLVRIVHVVDTTPPVITITGDNPASIDINVPYPDAGATVTDNCGGMIDFNVVSTVNTAVLGTYTVTYTATDASGNSAQAVRTVLVVDDLPPQITILGSNPTIVSLNGTYTDAGATAIDNGDGDLTALIQVDSNVNTAVLGAYTVNYSVTDSHGNTTTATRIVSVEEVGIEIIYMPPYGEEDYIYGKITGVDPATIKVSLVIQYLELWYIKETIEAPSVTIYPDGTFYYWFCSHDNDKNATAFYFTVLPINAEPELCLPCFTRPEHPEAIVTLLVPRDPNSRTIWFSGHTYDTKYSGEILVDPGQIPYANTEESIWLDGNGYLHLRLIYRNGKYYGVEFVGQESPGYGTICATTLSDLSNFQPEPVFGFFTYDVSAPLVNFREIDILEVAKWLIPDLPTNAQNVLQKCSVCPSADPHCHRFLIDAPDGRLELTHYLVWQPGYIECRTYYGTYSLTDLPPADKLFNQWIYTGTDVPVPGNEKIRGNIWLKDGIFPSNGQEVEVVLSYLDFMSTVPNWDEEVDTTPAVIAIIGDNPLDHEAMTPYTDAGVTAIDNVDGDISASVTVENTVNPNLLGAYTVTYSVTDTAGNSAQAIRIVNVVDTTPPVIIAEGEMEIDTIIEGPVGENFTAEILPAGYNWIIVYLIGEYSNTGKPDCAVAIDSQDQAYLLFQNNTSMVLVNNNQGLWGKKTTWPTIASATYCSLALSADDKIYISAIGSGTGEKLLCLTNKNGTWISQTVNSLNSIGLENSILIDELDNVTIAYWQWVSGGRPGGSGNMYVSQNNATNTWTNTLIGATNWYPLSVALDNAKKIHLIHSVGTTLMHTTNASGSWLSGSTLTGYSANSTKMDDAEKIWIASDNGITTNASGSWVTENIFATLLPTISSYNIYLDEDALAIDSVGNMHLCFLQRSDYSDPTKWQALIYASNLLGTWQLEIIDSWTVSSADYRIMPPSLALDSQDTAHVVYYNLEDNKVRYTNFDPYAVFGATK